MSKFFILCCSRSGSTLLASLLNSHPDIVVPSETWWLSTAQTFGQKQISCSLVTRMFLRRIRSNLKSGSDTEILTAFDAVYSRIKSYTGAYDGLLRLFAEQLPGELSKKVFGEKTPANTTFYPEINISFQDFRKIILLRDPRDILCSYINTWHAGDYDEANILTSAVIIKVYLHNIMMNRQSDDLLVRYEDLTNDPQVEIRRICEYLDVEVSNDLSKDYAPIIKADGHHAKLAKGIVRNSGKYATLEKSLQETMEFVFQSEMDALGYSRQYPNPKTDSPLLARIDDFVRAKLEVELPVKLSVNWRCPIICHLRQFGRALTQIIRQ